MTKRKFITIERTGYYYHDAWDKYCVFGVQKNPTTDKRCKECPFKIKREFTAPSRCIERNTRFLLVKSWVTHVVSVSEFSTISIWAHQYLTEDQLDELMRKGEYKYVKHEHEKWHFYRLQRLAKIFEGCRGSENNDLVVGGKK